jgi:hypothetical protein
MMNQEQVLMLLNKNVNENTEKKNGLTYLSWAWAWAEALKADPDANFKIEMFGDKCYMDINGTAMVFVTVTLFGKPIMCQLPVMDSYNKSITVEGVTTVNKYGKEITTKLDSFNVNTAIMRCMTKALSLHGLGLYIYAGEDLPEGESGSDIDVNAMIDHLAAIDAASNMEELKNVYTAAYSACGSDKGWQKKVIDAKEKRKGALK